MLKKPKGTKKCIMKRIIKFNDYKNCLFKNEIILKSQQRSKSEACCVYTEEVNKSALSSNDDKRFQTFDRIATYPYGTNAFEVCESEMLSKYKLLILMIIQMKIKKNIYSRSTIQSISNSRFRITKNKYIIKFNKLSTRY